MLLAALMASVRVWWAALASAGPHLRKLLDDSEHGRMNAYRRHADADRFLLGAAITRMVAGQETGSRPRAIRVDRSCPSCGRPHGRVRLPGTGLHISVAHSGDAVGVAMTVTGPVGLDVEIESVRGDYLDLARWSLTPREMEALSMLPRDNLSTAFLRYWVRKEAVLKLSGDGIADLRAVSVSAPDAPPEVLSWPERPELAARLALLDLKPPSGHLAAVAFSATLPIHVVELDATEMLADI